MGNKLSIPVANTEVNRNLVSSQMMSANVQNGWRAPNLSGVISDANKVFMEYNAAQKDAAFKRLDLEAGKMQMQELEDIRLAESNERVPEIEKNFASTLKNYMSQDSWGKKWLKERSGLFLAANSRDVMRAGLAKQHELYQLEMSKTLNTWADDIANSKEDKARVLYGDANKYIESSGLLSPTEKQKAKESFAASTLQKMISANPSGAVNMLDDANYNWSELGVDKDRYKKAALASAADANEKRLIAQINSNRQAASELIAKSQEARLSLDEINKAVPASSKELRDFLYSINGYTKSGNVSKLSAEEKALNEQALYDDFAALLGNPNTKIEDWQDFENKVYAAMTNKSITKQNGLSLLDNFATPFMKKWQNALEDAGNNHWIGKDFGYEALNKWIKKDVLGADLKKEDYKNNETTYKKLTAARARTKAEIYRQYNEALQNVAKQAGLSDIGAIKDLSDTKQDELYGIAQDMVIQNYNKTQYRQLMGMEPQNQPNSVLDNSGLVKNTGNQDNSKQGTPIADVRYKGTAYDATSGKYGLVRADGSIEEVSYDKYKQFGGLK